MRMMQMTLVAAVAWLGGATAAGAAELSAEARAKVEAKTAAVKALAADPAVVAAVRAYNAAPPAEAKTMTQEKWKGLSVLDPAVRGYAKNAAAEALKARKDASMAEAFVSGADGGKVAFLGKPSNWSHAGKPKHAIPMSGKVWTGPVEVDESTGQEQVQVAVPVLDGGRPVGSLVVGLAVRKLN